LGAHAELGGHEFCDVDVEPAHRAGSSAEREIVRVSADAQDARGRMRCRSNDGQSSRDQDCEAHSHHWTSMLSGPCSPGRALRAGLPGPCVSTRGRGGDAAAARAAHRLGISKTKSVPPSALAATIFSPIGPKKAGIAKVRPDTTATYCLPSSS